MVSVNEEVVCVQGVEGLIDIMRDQSGGCFEMFLVKCSTLRMRLKMTDGATRGAIDVAAERIHDREGLCAMLLDLIDHARSWADIHAKLAGVRPECPDPKSYLVSSELRFR